MTLAELLASKKQGTGRFPWFGLADLLARRNEPLDAKFNPSGVGPGVSYGSLASILADFAPGIGDVKSAADAIKEAEAGNYGMSLADAFGALPLIGGMGAIKAFHGSPHAFDAFDMSKIGTGEGAQAYGHGLYFAESPETAKSYSRNDYGSQSLFVDGVPLSDVMDGYGLSAGIRGKISKAAAQAGSVDEFLGILRDNVGPSVGEKNRSSFERLQERLASSNSSFPVKGNLYETSLEWPDPAREAADPLGPQHFLDWDKPLSEQPESLRGIFDNAPSPKGANGLHMGGDSYILDNSNRQVKPNGMTPWVLKSGDSMFDLTQRDVDRMLSGQTAEAGYSRLVSALGSQGAASDYLRQAGIPGIRYLDQGSRGAGNGTYNYVVFDDKIPRIISRNGVTLADLLKR